ncbi:poly-gamma-glutamate hydrolase family protein [Staphylococcus warneri]|uniref:poly-gamma-glutamate hydrolase family protein n=1 Tax=Staphylococcus warneri TaxID=1292 RepID=UPI001F5A2F8F|nr:poly-gamma-glutamate hydrolase family protein [Staphylococcus warneri]MCI2748310.1 poly-gamma-glutamate hydrolase family protein [Staphylococcus warneri]MCI2776695.1 poly-gamma-glutamate hydrolase family protein [Staphylococcus warneri]
MKRYVTKKAKPIVKITLGLITASISLGTISVVTQQATAHASTLQTTYNHTSAQNQTRTSSTTPHISQSKKAVKRVTTTVKAPTTVKTTTKVAAIKQPTQTVKAVSVSAPKTNQTSTIKTSTSHTQKPTSAKAPTSIHPKSGTTSTKSSTNHATTKSPITKPTVSKTSTTSTKTSTTTRPPSQTSKTVSKTSTSTAKAPTTSTSRLSTKPSTTTVSSTKPVTSTTSTTTPKSANSKETTIPAIGTNTDVKPIKPIESAHKDYYTSMTQLERETKEDIDWKKETRDQGNQVLIVAPHGGNIEQGTSELTKLLAQQGGYDYFSFEATRPSNNTQLHVTSTHYDDPTLHQMVEGRSATISIHGAKGDDPIVFLGGAKSDLRDEIQSQLEIRGFTVQVPPEYLGGLNENNFINKNENSTGVQLELTISLRKALFNNQDMSTSSRKNEDNWSPLMYQFADALHMAISKTTDTSAH